MGCPLSYIPIQGKRTGEDPAKLLSNFHPWVGGNKERAGKNVLRVSKDKQCGKMMAIVGNNEKKHSLT
jgi:hypothetical protein